MFQNINKKLVKSNLDVSIGDTERWVGCIQRQCNQNILSAAKPAQRSVSQILTSEFDLIITKFLLRKKLILELGSILA